MFVEQPLSTPVGLLIRLQAFGETVLSQKGPCGDSVEQSRPNTNINS